MKNPFAERRLYVIFGVGLVCANLAPAQAWIERFPTVAPSSDLSYDLAYDIARQEVVLFGGRTLPTQPETWVWDGQDFTLRSLGGPSARRDPAMAYDEARGVVVLSGGRSLLGNEALLADTWEWDGATWTSVSTADHPQNSVNGLFEDTDFPLDMAYDRERGVMVAVNAVGEVWEYDGATWSEQFPIIPVAVLGSILAENGNRQVLATNPSTDRVVGLDRSSTLTAEVTTDLLEYQATLGLTTWVPLSSSADELFTSGASLSPGPGDALYVVGFPFFAEDALMSTYRFDADGTLQLVPTASSPLASPIPLPLSDNFENLKTVYDSTRDRIVYIGQDGPIGQELQVWEFTLDSTPASVETYGQACGSPPLLLLPTGSRPRLGTTMSLRVAPVFAGPSATIVGLERPVLPIPLGFLGAIGCDLQVASTIASVGNTPLPPLQEQFSISIPNAPALIGTSIYCQAAALSPIANPLGVVFSNGIELQVGDL